AELDTAVTVETYVQAKQSWWDNKATFYTQDEDGAYFIYEMACTKEQYDALVPGTKIRVSGYKAEWSGEVEITDATFEVIPGSFIAEPADVTELLGTDGLIGKQNQYVTFKGLNIVAYDEEGAAFAYKNAEEKSDDLYFKASHGENIYSFCVEFYLCGKDTDVYKAVENLKVGDAVDITGYLYWYNGMNPHVTAIEAAGIMSYEEYAAAELDTAVTVETYVQAKQSWWDNKATFYTQNEDGAYFLYEMACTKEQYDALVPGTKIRVNGFKAEWAGEVEITDAVYEVIPGSYIAEAQDVTALLGTDDLIVKQNQYVTFKGLTIAAYDEDGAAFAYKNAEEKTDDLYFKATLGENTYSFCVEFYLCGKDTDVYKAVEGLKVGDKVDITGYLYWYNGMNPHVTAIAKAAAEE
ncbi:MAG: hypothetical protein J6U26_06345, partial [Lachnospiraceae bacterium]|nr:hypothetical protein [Lachnospiraceae bacterium]